MSSLNKQTLTRKLLLIATKAGPGGYRAIGGYGSYGLTNCAALGARKYDAYFSAWKLRRCGFSDHFLTKLPYGLPGEEGESAREGSKNPAAMAPRSCPPDMLCRYKPH